MPIHHSSIAKININQLSLTWRTTLRNKNNLKERDKSIDAQCVRALPLNLTSTVCTKHNYTINILCIVKYD